MQLLDVNVLVYAFRKDYADQVQYKRWLQELVNAPGAFGVSELVLSGCVRIVTHPKVFAQPDSTVEAVGFAEKLRMAPRAVVVRPGNRHWELFCDLCVKSGAKGNLVADAYHAALAIEHGCEWVTTDRDYARFPGLTWRHPLAGKASS